MSDKGNNADSEDAAKPGTADTPKKPTVNWDDPAVPIGNAPSLPRWPLLVMGITYLACIGFLVTMLLSRLQGPAG